MPRAIVLLIVACVAAGCGTQDSGPSGAGPTAPSPPVVHPPAVHPPGFLIFFEPGTGLSTTDLRDAHEQILRISTMGELVWVADGSRLPGYTVRGLAIEGAICPEGCAFVVRFGSRDGERRAYLTVDYGHDNPGTLVDVKVSGGTLVARQTDMYPPGSPTLSGLVTEMTAAGLVPVGGATVYRGVETGWRNATTDAAGFYEIRGLYDGPEALVVGKDGCLQQTLQVPINGDTRVDVQLRRP